MTKIKQLFPGKRIIGKRIVDCARQNRHRIGFATIMAFIAGVIFYINFDIRVYGMPLPVFTGLLYGLIVGPAAYLTCLFLPACATLIETTAVSRLLLAIGVMNYPETGQHILASPMITATFIVCGALVLKILLYSGLTATLSAGWQRRFRGFSRPEAA